MIYHLHLDLDNVLMQVLYISYYYFWMVHVDLLWTYNKTWMPNLGCVQMLEEVKVFGAFYNFWS